MLEEFTDSIKKKLLSCDENIDEKAKSVLLSGVPFYVSNTNYEKISELKENHFKSKKEIIKIYQKYANVENIIRSDIAVKNDLDLLYKDKTLFSKLVELYLYSRLDLQGKLSSIITGILNKDSLSIAFEGELDQKDKKEISKISLSILTKVQDIYDDKDHFNALIAYLLINSEEEIRKSLFSEFSVPNRLSYVQEKTKSYNSAQKYPFAWTYWIEKYSSEKELLKFLDSAQIYKRLKFSPFLASNFYSSFPLETDKREKIIQAFLKLKESNNPFEVESSIRLYQNERLRNYLKNKNVGFEKPIFQVRRQFYINQLKSKNSISYSLFQLMKMGNFDKEFIPYIYASKI